MEGEFVVSFIADQFSLCIYIDATTKAMYMLLLNIKNLFFLFNGYLKSVMLPHRMTYSVVSCIRFAWGA